jgi:hypothetical protein
MNSTNKHIEHVDCTAYKGAAETKKRVLNRLRANRNTVVLHWATAGAAGRSHLDRSFHFDAQVGLTRAPLAGRQPQPKVYGIDCTVFWNVGLVDAEMARARQACPDIIVLHLPVRPTESLLDIILGVHGAGQAVMVTTDRALAPAGVEWAQLEG